MLRRRKGKPEEQAEETVQEQPVSEQIETPTPPEPRRGRSKTGESGTASRLKAAKDKRKASESAPSEIAFMFREIGDKTEEVPKAKPAPRKLFTPKKEDSRRRSDSKPAERKQTERKPQERRQQRQEPKPRAVKPAPEKPAKVAPTPFTPIFESVEIPEDGPRIVRINGKPSLVVNKNAIPPLFFFGNPASEQSSQTVFEEVKKAAAAGVHVHVLMVDFPVDSESAQEAFDFSAYLLAETLRADPDAMVFFRVIFAGVKGWEKKYAKAAFNHVDGSPAEPSVCDDNFWGDAQRLLGAYVRGLREIENCDRILGLHLDRGEWFFAEGWGYDVSQSAEMLFAEWAKNRYQGDQVGLQAAWFDGKSKFDSLRVPSYLQAPLSGDGFLRSGRKERKWVDYHLFLSDATVRRIQMLANEVKRASAGWFLVGVSYGYTFEWSHPASAHLSLGKLLRANDIDIIAGPPSYKDRHMGGAAAFPGPIDSFSLNGKLYVSEEDFKTPIGKDIEPDDFNPAMGTPQALEAAHWRGLGSALAHGTGICWMDLWGNGWLNTPAIWNRAVRVRECLTRSLASKMTDPEVAVLIDERSLAYLSDQKAFKQLIQDSREAVLRAGVSAGFYLLSDLAHRSHFPEAKLYIFLNAWDIRPEVRHAIRTRLQRANKTLFWVYSAGQFESGRPALERVREVTGIAIRPQPFLSKAGTTILSRRHPLTELLEERALSVVEQLEPSYFAIPEDGCTILGEYTQTGLPSLVVREVKSEEDASLNWRSVFLGEPIINEKIIRGLCAFAGVQIWNHSGDVVHARRPFLSIHYSGSGHRTATLPDRWNAFDLANDVLIESDATHFTSQATDGATQVLLVGEEAEVQELSTVDLDALRILSELPEPEDDTVTEEFESNEVPLLGMPDASELLSMLADSADVAENENDELPVKRREPRGGRQPRQASPDKNRQQREKPKSAGPEGKRPRSRAKPQKSPDSLGVMFRDKD